MKKSEEHTFSDFFYDFFSLKIFRKVESILHYRIEFRNQHVAVIPILNLSIIQNGKESKRKRPNQFRISKKQ